VDGVGCTLDTKPAPADDINDDTTNKQTKPNKQKEEELTDTQVRIESLETAIRRSKRYKHRLQGHRS
jgi:hypothetical protein